MHIFKLLQNLFVTKKKKFFFSGRDVRKDILQDWVKGSFEGFTKFFTKKDNETNKRLAALYFKLIIFKSITDKIVIICKFNYIVELMI